MSDLPNTQTTQKIDDGRPIRVLPPQLANQIAAGEVVERPASVVKELVENSLDAGATQVHIEIDQGGQKRILVRDNGKGISKDQLSLALSRHATSKISCIDDLEYITSMGFRGEALASISSVSRLTLTSKPISQNEAWQAQAEGQQMEVELHPAAHPDGTSIEVIDLFFNTPARRKFLRTGKTEFQHIEQIIKRIALTRPDVQFVLSHNNKVCCRYLIAPELSKRIEQVCGKNILPNSTFIEYDFENISLKAWCSKLGIGNATRDLQYTFVNGRMMKDKLLSHALRQVYEDTLGPQAFPSYVLYLEVPPNQLDVNVHPAKHEVRFHQARQIHDLVFKAITDGLSSASEPSSINETAQSPSHNYIQPLSQDTNPKRQSSFGGSGNIAYRPNAPTSKQIKASNAFYSSLKSGAESADDEVNEGLVLSESHCLYCPPYLVFGEAGSITVMDVNILIEKLIALRLNRSTLSQPLLMPVSIENSRQIKQAELDAYEDVHLVVSATHNKLILKKVPSELRQLPWASIFASIDIYSVGATDILSSSLAMSIATAWLNTLQITESMLSGWINEVGQVELTSLLKAHAKSLPLAPWMQNE
jgi:DNA mismatch repair protein MutL